MKKLISFSLAVSMLLSATACGREENDNIDDLIDAAEDIIDPGFNGIVSSGRKYCYGDDANGYRKEIQDEEDFDSEWLMIVENGDITFFYADDFDEKAESDGRIPREYKGMTLEEIYDYYVEEQENEAPTEAVTTAPVTTAETTTTAPATTTTAAVQFPNAVEPIGELKLSQGGTTCFTIVSANNELNPIFNNWIEFSGIDASMVNFMSLECSGYDASERIDRMFISGDDIDVYIVEPGWAHNFIDDYSKAAPMSDLGFNDKHFSGAYPYTIELGTSIYGDFTASSPIVSPGAFAYNTLLAEEYLGVTSPEEMQALIGDWESFMLSAEAISGITDGKVALADSLEGLMFVYDQGRTRPWVMDGQLNIDDFCREMADTAKNLWDIGGVSKNVQWSYEWLESGEKMETVGYFTADWGLGSFLLQASGSNTYGEWAICQGPQPFYWGGSSIVVNPATDNGDLAQSLIYYTCIDEGSMMYNASVTGQFVNNADVMEYAIDNGNIKIPAEVSENLSGQNYLWEFQKNALAINNSGLTTPYDSDALTFFMTSMRNIYLKGGSYDETEEYARKLMNDYLELK
ncbi:MAG: hypothetical protein NC093_02375 [Alistipes sp.]|nr:hypothetical protein [Alistipes sp.]